MSGVARGRGWTAGPWQDGGWDVFDNDGEYYRCVDTAGANRLVATVPSGLYSMDPVPPAAAEIVANAHLIAAAPDLYAALDALVDLMERGQDISAALGEYDDAIAALAQARGEAGRGG